MNEFWKSSDAQEGTAEALQTFILPYREPNGSLLRLRMELIHYTQHFHLDN